MRTKMISITYGRKFNMALIGHGEYESAHIEVTAWADLDETDDPLTAGEELRQFCRGQVRSEFLRLLPKNDKVEEPEETEEEPKAEKPQTTPLPQKASEPQKAEEPRKPPESRRVIRTERKP